jgi:hypothetical protein
VGGDRQRIEQRLRAAFVLGPEPPPASPLILEVIR